MGPRIVKIIPMIAMTGIMFSDTNPVCGPAVKKTNSRAMIPQIIVEKINEMIVKNIFIFLLPQNVLDHLCSRYESIRCI